MVFVLVVDGVDDGVGALSGLDGFGKVFEAAAVAAIGEQDEGAAPLLLGDDLVGSEKDGVEESGAATLRAVRMTTIAAL